MQEKKNRPDKVSNAVTMLWITIAIGVVRSILEFSNLTQTTSSDFIIFVQIFTFAIIAFFIYKIGEGRNWARIIFLVLFIIGIPQSILPMIQSLIASPISGILGIGQTILKIIALVFLFQKPSSDWFKITK